MRSSRQIRPAAMLVRGCRRSVGLLLGLVLALGLPTQASAAWPEQPVKLVVGFPPGGGGDLYGRLIATALSKSLGQQVIVDNKAGAGGNIAADAVAKAKPDGYTLLSDSSAFATFPALYKDLNFDPVKDLIPLTQMSSLVSVLMEIGRAHV